MQGCSWFGQPGPVGAAFLHPKEQKFWSHVEVKHDISSTNVTKGRATRFARDKMFVLKYSDYNELSVNTAASTNMTQQEVPRAAVKKGHFL